jgi:hypothetical protein
MGSIYASCCYRKIAWIYGHGHVKWRKKDEIIKINTTRAGTAYPFGAPEMSVTDTIIGRWELAVANDVNIKTGRWSNIGAQTFNNYQYYVTWKSINYTLLESFCGDPFSNWNFFNSPKFPRLNITNIKSSFHDNDLYDI